MGWPINQTDKTMKADIENLIGRVDGLESYRGECEENHRHHNQYRRDTDNKMDGILTYQKSTDETVKKMLSIMESYAPTVKRSTNNYVTIDTLKSWFLWIAAAAGAFSAVEYLKGLF